MRRSRNRVLVHPTGPVRILSIGPVLLAGLASVLLLAATAVAQTAPPPVLGSTKAGTGIPTGPSPDAKGNLYSIDVYYFNADGSLGKSSVTVPNIPVTAGLPNPTPAQILAARTAKAKAIVDAINAAKLNGVTATVDPKDPTQYTVNGVRQSIQKYQFPKPGTPGTYLGPAITRTPGNRVTGEIGNTKFNFQKNAGGGGGGGGGSPGSMYNASFYSPGTNAGLFASGLDGSGDPSVVGFGFLDLTGASPVDYYTTITPAPDWTDAQILGKLATQFTTDFSSAGFTAHFDSSLDSLILDQALPNVDPTWSADSDTVLDFKVNQIDTPEPASATLLALGAVLLVLLLRNGKRGQERMALE